MAAPPFKVKAVYEYSSEHDDDLKFPIGTVINVTEEEGDDWYVGEYTDGAGMKQEGLFPRNFVERYEPEVPTRPTRAARPKSMAMSPPPRDPELEQDETEEQGPPIPAASKRQAPPVEIPPPSDSTNEEVRSPPSANSQQTPVSRAEPPAAPKPVPAEPAISATPVKVAPPPVAPKSNAFKDRIAAFNKAEQAPIAPMQSGRQAQANDYIKKPFVAPPPKSTYVPPVQKQEPVHRPYVREEDPEIKARQEQDRQAAEAAGLNGEALSAAAAEEDEDAPKPMSLKERMALLQEQQRKQAERNSDAPQKRERKPPAKKPSGSSERAVMPEAEEEGESEDVRGGEVTERQSLDVSRERPRVPSAQRRPEEVASPVPAAPTHELLSGGEEADQSAAGETTEDDAGTIGPNETNDRSAPATRAPETLAREADVGDEEGSIEEADAEEELDEEELRKQRLRERMARLAGGPPGAAGGMFNPFGAPAASAAAPKKKPSKRTSEEAAQFSPPQPPQPMVAIPGMGGAMSGVQSPVSDSRHRGVSDEPIQQGSRDEQEEEEPTPPPRRLTTEDRGAPPVPKGKMSPRYSFEVPVFHQAMSFTRQIRPPYCPLVEAGVVFNVCCKNAVVRWFYESWQTCVTHCPSIGETQLDRLVTNIDKQIDLSLLSLPRNEAHLHHHRVKAHGQHHARHRMSHALCRLLRPLLLLHRSPQALARSRMMKCRCMLSAHRQRRPESRRRCLSELRPRAHVMLRLVRPVLQTTNVHLTSVASLVQQLRTRGQAECFLPCQGVLWALLGHRHRLRQV